MFLKKYLNFDKAKNLIKKLLVKDPSKRICAI